MTELSPNARALIDATRDADNPTDGDRTRVRAAMLAQIAAGSAALGSAETASAAQGVAAKAAGTSIATTGGLAAKILVATVFVSSVALGGYSVLRRSGDDNKAATRETPANINADDSRPTLTPPVPTPPTTPLPSAPAIAAEPPHAEPPHANAAKALDDVADTHDAVVKKRSTTARRTRAAPRTKRRAVATKAPAAKHSQPAKDPMATLLAEKKLISGANAALRRGNANQALTLLNQHAKQHPRGMLSANRNGARVLALCQLGKAKRARREATKFLARWSKHPMAERVRRACAAPRAPMPSD